MVSNLVQFSISFLIITTISLIVISIPYWHRKFKDYIESRECQSCKEKTLELNVVWFSGSIKKHFPITIKYRPWENDDKDELIEKLAELEKPKYGL